MTQLEAKDRARQIWGETVVAVAFGGARVKGATLDGPILGEVWDVLCAMSRHSMDENGHATCHQECAETEAAVGQ